MQPAARLTDLHVCPMVTGVVPHVGGPINTVGAPDSIVAGAPTVLIAGQPAARLGDSTAHGGVITLGCFTVLIG